MPGSTKRKVQDENTSESKALKTSVEGKRGLGPLRAKIVGQNRNAAEEEPEAALKQLNRRTSVSGISKGSKAASVVKVSDVPVGTKGSIKCRRQSNAVAKASGAALVAANAKELADLTEQIDECNRENEELRLEQIKSIAEYAAEATLRRELSKRLQALTAENTATKQACEAAQEELAAATVEKEIADTLLAKQTAALEEATSEKTAAEEVAATQAVSLEAQATEIAALKEAVVAADNVRRQMHNTIQDLKGNIRVFCRVRPLLPREQAAAAVAAAAAVVPVTAARAGTKHAAARTAGKATAASPSPSLMTLNVPTGDVEQRRIKLQKATSDKDSSKATCTTHDFSFDRVFSDSAGQGEVFTEVGDLVQSVMDGFNACIFAYGQTGSGKTWTMEGSMECADDMGIIPRSMQRLFAVRNAMAGQQGWSFDMQASQLEIYNETIRDLLSAAPAGGSSTPGGSTPGGSGSGGGGVLGSGMTPVKHGANGDTSVNGLSVHSVEGVEDVLSLLTRAQANRSVASTKMNSASSRSHAVFLLKVCAVHAESGASRSGHLVLVDLAGSEKIGQSGAKGEQLKEANAINKSLSSLGNVIVALAKKQKHVPFRDSTLTYLLQNCLQGDSKTLMLVNVSPSVEHTSETLCSLRFAHKVNACDVGVAKKHGAGATPSS